MSRTLLRGCSRSTRRHDEAPLAAIAGSICLLLQCRSSESGVPRDRRGRNSDAVVSLVTECLERPTNRLVARQRAWLLAERQPPGAHTAEA